MSWGKVATGTHLVLTPEPVGCAEGQAGEREGASRTPGAWPEPLEGQSCHFLGQEVGEAGRLGYRGGGRLGYRGGRGWEVGRSPGRTREPWEAENQEPCTSGSCVGSVGSLGRRREPSPVSPAGQRWTEATLGAAGTWGVEALVPCPCPRGRRTLVSSWEAGPSRGWWSGGRRVGSCAAADGGSQAQGGLPAPTPGTRGHPSCQPPATFRTRIPSTLSSWASRSHRPRPPSAQLSRPGGRAGTQHSALGALAPLRLPDFVLGREGHQGGAGTPSCATSGSSPPVCPVAHLPHKLGFLVGPVDISVLGHGALFLLCKGKQLGLCSPRSRS